MSAARREGLATVAETVPKGLIADKGEAGDGAKTEAKTGHFGAFDHPDEDFTRLTFGQVRTRVA